MMRASGGRRGSGGELQEVASGSDQPAKYEDMQIGSIETAKLWSSMNGECLKTKECHIMNVEIINDDGGECLKTLQGMVDPDMKLRIGDPDEYLRASSPAGSRMPGRRRGAT
jgi:hypothetical protein